jgi:hypothetical protein
MICSGLSWWPTYKNSVFYWKKTPYLKMLNWRFSLSAYIFMLKGPKNWSVITHSHFPMGSRNATGAQYADVYMLVPKF